MFYDTDSIADTFNEGREKRENHRKSNVGKNKKKLPVNIMTVQKNDQNIRQNTTEQH